MKKRITRIFILIAALTALLLCACAPYDGTPRNTEPAVTEPTAAGLTDVPATEEPSIMTDDPNAPKVLGCEERVLGGEAVKLDLEDLETPGIALDIDGDGTKELITAGPNDSSPDILNAIYVNGEKTRVVSAEGEYWLISLFGDSIQIAIMGEETFEYDMIKYCAGGGTEGRPSPRRAVIVSCFIESRDYWTQNGTKLMIPCDDIMKLEYHSTIEEYLHDGAQAELLFPPMVVIDDNHDLNYLMDLDNDGAQEELRIIGGRVLVFEKGGQGDPVYELPYPVYDDEGDEGSFAVIAEYGAKGFDCRIEENVRVLINGAEVGQDSYAPVFGERGIFFADPETQTVRIAFGDSDNGWKVLSYDNGEGKLVSIINRSSD